MLLHQIVVQVVWKFMKFKEFKNLGIGEIYELGNSTLMKVMR
jgi:hypothetical protein